MIQYGPRDQSALAGFPLLTEGPSIALLLTRLACSGVFGLIPSLLAIDPAGRFTEPVTLEVLTATTR